MTRGHVRLSQFSSWGVAGIVFLLPLYFNPLAELSFEPAKVELFRYAVVATAFVSLLAHYFETPLRPSWGPAVRRLFLAVAIYGATYSLATVLSVSPHVSLLGNGDAHGAATLLVTLLFFFLVSTMSHTRETRERIVNALLLGTVPVMVYGLVQVLHLDPLTWETDAISPMGSTLGRSNFVGAYLAMVVPFTMYRLMDVSSPACASCWRTITLLSLQITCIFLTQARAAWCAAIVGFAVVLYLRRRTERRRAIRPLLVVAGAGAILLAVMNVVDIASLTRSGERRTVADVAAHRAGTARSRVAIWQGTLELIPSHWVLGHGPETFTAFFDSSALALDEAVIVTHPHNIVLEHLFSVGAAGLLAFVFVAVQFYVMTMGRLAEAKSASEKDFLRALVGSASAYLMQAQLNPDVIVLSSLFWLVLGLGAGACARVLSN